MQTALPVVVALTASRGGQSLGLSGLVAPENRLNTFLPMATVAITGLINMFVLRPLTTKTMRERKHQGEDYLLFTPFFFLFLSLNTSLSYGQSSANSRRNS